MTAFEDRHKRARAAVRSYDWTLVEAAIEGAKAMRAMEQGDTRAASNHVSNMVERVLRVTEAAEPAKD